MREKVDKNTDETGLVCHLDSRLLWLLGRSSFRSSFFLLSSFGLESLLLLLYISCQVTFFLGNALTQLEPAWCVVAVRGAGYKAHNAVQCVCVDLTVL